MLRLEMERRERGWTKAKLAQRAGMHASDVGKVEGKRVRPYECWKKRLAKALGIPVAQADQLFEEVHLDGEQTRS